MNRLDIYHIFFFRFSYSFYNASPVIYILYLLISNTSFWCKNWRESIILVYTADENRFLNYLNISFRSRYYGAYLDNAHNDENYWSSNGTTLLWSNSKWDIFSFLIDSLYLVVSSLLSWHSWICNIVFAFVCSMLVLFALTVR